MGDERTVIYPLSHRGRMENVYWVSVFKWEIVGIIGEDFKWPKELKQVKLCFVTLCIKLIKASFVLFEGW